MSTKKETVYCKICNMQTKYTTDTFSRYHLKPVHTISVQDYYDKYLGNGDDKCKLCGNKCSFITMNQGYYDYCSNDCRNKDPEFRKMLSHAINTKVDKEKAKETRKKTCKKKYGKEFVFQIEEFQEKQKQTLIEKYGVSHNFLMEDCIEKRWKTLNGNKEEINKKRKAFWTDTNIKKVNDTRIETLHERYGADIDNVMDLDGTIEAINKTFNEKYGEDWFVETDMFRQIMEDVHGWIPEEQRQKYYNYCLKVLKETRKYSKLLFNNWNGLCYYTCFKLNNIQMHSLQVTIDHKTSKYYGYINDISPIEIGRMDNLCLCSRYINLYKNKKTEQEFYDSLQEDNTNCRGVLKKYHEKQNK